ncbi:unnamed protein product [Soboliphyme baturini]|uniref:Uncharacterized protein n=1 Tax=Soboliphyme baturini TaxID=241478 RepID=A0A183IWY6_9BILA|nr:unnamed protein product [Soboliphyme baturini]
MRVDRCRHDHCPSIDKSEGKIRRIHAAARLTKQSGRRVTTTSSKDVKHPPDGIIELKTAAEEATVRNAMSSFTATRDTIHDRD